MAVPSSGTPVPARSTVSDAMQSKKNELLAAAGRRKLEEYKKKNKKVEKKEAKDVKDGGKSTPSLLKSSDGECVHDDSVSANVNSQKWSPLENDSSIPSSFSASDQVGAMSTGELLVQSNSLVADNISQQHEEFKKNKLETNAEDRDGGRNAKAIAVSGIKSVSAAEETLLHIEGRNSAYILDRVKFPNGTYPMLGSEPQHSVSSDNKPSSVSNKEKQSAISVFNKFDIELKSNFGSNNHESQQSTFMAVSSLTEEKADLQIPGSYDSKILISSPLSYSLASNKLHFSSSAVAPPSSMSTTFLPPSISFPLSASLASQNTKSQVARQTSASILSRFPSTDVSFTIQHPSPSAPLPCTSVSTLPLLEFPSASISSQSRMFDWPFVTHTSPTVEHTSFLSSLPSGFTSSPEFSSSIVSTSPLHAVTLPSMPLPPLLSLASEVTNSQVSWSSSIVAPLSTSPFVATQHSSPFLLPDSLSVSTDASVPSSHLALPKTEEVIPLQSSLSSSPVEALHEGQDTLKDINSKNWSHLQSRASERDEFAALEQHIDDLTQEKFSLQRALDAARSLTESLAQENSSLTENFNQQATMVNQLKADLERQAEEIGAQALVLGSFREEREKAHQESNSALERSQILAGEVIALEEKVLRLRSSELKLERDLEALKAENDSYKRHIHTMEKDQQNLRSMVEALQEEKKILEGRIRKGTIASEQQTPSKASVDISNCKDVATSTDDLGVESKDSQAADSLSLDISASLSQLGENSKLTPPFLVGSAVSVASLINTTGLSTPAAPLSIPSDQLNIVENINLLMSELSKERDSLVKDLNVQSSEAARLRVLNEELLQKLELQTQRFELAVAQNMAHGGPQVVNPYEQPQDEVEYLDEGDEVVERVLGWIMKLFPGGSSKRRSSKLL